MIVPIAHGIAQRADLPITLGLFLFGSTIVLVVSFVALAVLWRRPLFEPYPWRPLPGLLGRIWSSRPVEILCGAIGVFLLFVVVYTGLTGQQTAASNFAPTFVYVIFWVGLVAVSILFWDIFRAFNPWRAIGRAVAFVARLGSRGELPPPLAYPKRLGYWPAMAGLLAFTALELVNSTPDDPSTVAVATLVYSVATFIGMALYGVDAWSERGEAFSVYFNFFSRLSPLETRDGVLGLRPPLAGVTGIKAAPGLMGVVAAMIGTVSFDGLAETTLWVNVGGKLGDLFEGIGFSSETAFEISNAVGLVTMVGLVFALYRLGIAGMKILDERNPASPLADLFAPTLVPIALAYVGAHYMTLLAFQGQAAVYLASDPLGDGSDLFGTADVGISYFMGARLIQWLWVALVVGGHVAGLSLAHDRALVVYRDDQDKVVPSQLWMLAVMILFTISALLLLLSGNA